MTKVKPPISLWIIEQRKLKGWKPAELARLLRERGCQAEEGTVRTWEAGRSPRPETIRELERLFGTPAPRTSEEQGDLVEAIRAQTVALTELAQAIREDRDRISPEALRLFLEQLRSEGLLATPGTPASSGVPEPQVEVG